MGLARVTWGRTGVWVAIVVGLTRVAVAQPNAQAGGGDADFPPLKIVELDVVDPATNKPVAGVHLSARVNNQQRTWTTADDGHARLDVDGGAQSLTVSATKDGFVPTTLSWSASPGAGPAIPDEYLLKLERGTTIGGTVTDPAGKPVAGAEVVLTIQRKGDQVPRSFFGVGGGSGAGGDDPAGGGGQGRASLSNVTVKTDPDGRWRFEQAPAQIESIRLRLAHPDFVMDEGMGSRTAPPEPKLRDLSSVMVMQPGVTIAGRVLNPQGQPVAGATVSLGVSQFRVKLPSAKSGADGRFALPHCRPGQRVTLVVTAAGWAPNTVDVQLEKDVADLEVKLEPPRTMRIRVLDAKGQPVVGATVGSLGWRGRNDPAWRATTDADGRAVWNDAPADGVGIGVSARGFIASAERDVVAGEQEHVVKLTPMTRIVGTVVDDATGKPVEKFLASVTSPPRPGVVSISFGEPVPATYGPGGTFEMLRNARRSPIVVRVEAAGYLPATSREVRPGEESVTLEFRLKKGKDVAATLRFADGTPVDRADVVLVGDSSQAIIRNGKLSPQTFAPRAKSDPAGRFRFGPQAGAYTVIVLHDKGFAEIPAERFAGAEEPTIEVGPWATIRGTAWVGSKPAAGQTVTAMDASGRRAARARIDASAVADAQGQFVLDRVPPGTVTVGIEVRSDDQVGVRRVTRVSWTQQRAVGAEAGKTVEVKLGGAGRAVVGQLVAPVEVGDKAEWKYAEVRLVSRIATKRQLPADWATLSPEARRKLDEAWFASPEGQAELKSERERPRSYPARVSPADGTFRADDVEAGDYYVTAQLMKATPVAGVAPAVSLQTWAVARREIAVAAGKADDPAVDLGKIELSTSPADGPNPIRRRPPTPAPAE